MSDKSKNKVTSDSGIELSRRSRSGSGSFAGIDRGSFSRDFADDDSGNASRRGTFGDDDDDYVDQEGTKVDLSAFLDVPPGDDVGDDDGEEEEEGSEEGDEDEDEEEDEGEYETEEEEDVVAPAPTDVVVTHVETPSQQEIDEEKAERKKKILKMRKKALINEYLHDVKRFNNLRSKNILLGLKILTHIDQNQAIVAKYIQRELDEQERLKEAERLKKEHYQENCAVFQDGNKKKEKYASKQSKKRSSKKKKKMRTHFSAPTGPQENTQTSSSDPDQMKELLKKKFDISAEHHVIPDVSLKTLEAEYVYNRKPIQRPDPMSPDITYKTLACKRKKYLRDRVGRKLSRFSFLRSLLYKEPPKPKNNRRSWIDLMNINIDKLKRSKTSRLLRERKSSKTLTAEAEATKKPLPTKRIPAAGQSTRSLGLSYGGGIKWKRKFNITQEAQAFARSKSRMALDHHKEEQRIRLCNDSTDYKDLHHFEFQFADPRLTAKQASVKLREELLKLLRQHHIPTTQLRWPLEVKGVDFEGKNPYGRVSLNYTRLSHHEKELPHTAYRILLTNMAFLKTKEQRMNKEHRKNMIQLEEECNSLQMGLNQIFNEIVEGLRIFASLCGITDHEKKEAKLASENFIQELHTFFEKFLTNMLVNLYKSINSCEFALRQLWISEGKGEGAELHEFKDIMRCREKLKAEHIGIERSINKYQQHSKSVLKDVRNSGKKMQQTKDAVGKKGAELERMKLAVDVMIEGMYHCQETVRSALEKEVQLKSETGILNSPVLTEDYNNLLVKMDNTKIKRIDLQRKYNSRVREIEKIMQPSSRFARYKLRS